MSTEIREFGNGAIRDTSKGKIEFYGVRHPLVELSFGKYMQEHTKLPNGETREFTNWWGGWSTDVSLQSMIRHLEDLQALHAGYTPIEIRIDGMVIKEYWKDMPHEITGDVRSITVEECLNAIRFNSGSYLLQYLKENENTK